MNKKNVVSSKKILDIDTSIRREIFCGTFEEAKDRDNEYCQFTLYSEKSFTITYLSELFYGKKAITAGF